MNIFSYTGAKLRAVGGKPFYSMKSDRYNADHRDLIEKLGVANSLPAELMKEEMRKVYVEAQRRLNEGKKSKGPRKSAMWAFHMTWNVIQKTYIDGTHSSSEELSWFKTPRERGAQRMESFNHAKNELSKLEQNGTRATCESYIGLAKALEKLQLDRVHELMNGAKWKVKIY